MDALIAHCTQTGGRYKTLWRQRAADEVGPTVGCFAAALPPALRSACTEDEREWTEAVCGIGAFMFHANSYEDAQFVAQCVVRAVESGVLMPPAGCTPVYWVLRETLHADSAHVVLFPELFMMPCLAMAIAGGRAVVTGKHPVPYTGNRWRAVGDGSGDGAGRLWTDAAAPGTVWLRTPPPQYALQYCTGAGPNLTREIMRKEQQRPGIFHPSWRQSWEDSGLVMNGMITRKSARVLYNGLPCELYFVGPQTYIWDGHELGQMYDLVRPVSNESYVEEFGYERVWPLTSIANEFPVPAEVRALPTSPIGNVSVAGCGIQWWAPVQSDECRQLAAVLPDARYENVGANDHIVFVFELCLLPVETVARDIMRRLWTAFRLVSDPPQPLHDDAGEDFMIDGLTVIATFAARRAYRPLLKELVADYAKGRSAVLKVRYQHWLPINMAQRHLYGSADSMRYLQPANRWGCVLEDSLRWPAREWWDPAKHRGPPVYADCEVAIWRDCAARRFGDAADSYWCEDMQRPRGEWVATLDQTAFERRLGHQHYVDEYRKPGEQIVGTHALVRLGWDGICSPVRRTLGVDKMANAVSAHLERLTPALDEYHVHPATVSERFGDIRVPGREGLTVVPMVAPCGAGKSTSALALAEEMLKGRWRAIFVSPRQSVVEQTIAQLRALRVNVIDGRNKEELAKGNVCYVDCCVTTIHSLHKLMGTFVKPPGADSMPIILFFDEIVTAFNGDYNSRIIPAEKVERALARLLYTSVKIAVLMDANLTPLVVGNFIERYVYGVRHMAGRSLQHLCVHVYPKAATYNMAALQGRSAVCYTAFDAQLQVFRAIKERLLGGRKVALFFSRRRSLEVWQRALQDVMPREFTLVYSGDSKVPLRDLCSLLKEERVRLFMYTTAAGAGVDVSFVDEAGDAVRCFDSVALVGASAPYLGPKDLEQAASRVRSVPELLVDLAGADIAGPFETMMWPEWQAVMEATDDEVLRDAASDAGYTQALTRSVQLDESVWMGAPPEPAHYTATHPYARLLAYNRLAKLSVSFRCQAFVATLSYMGYATRVETCPLPSATTLDANARLLKAELMCDIEEGDDAYNTVLANQRRGTIGLPPLRAGEPYVQRLEECVRRLAERDTADVLLQVRALTATGEVPRGIGDWERVARETIEALGVRRSTDGQGALGRDGMAFREVLTEGRGGKRVLQALALYTSLLACGLRGLFPVWDGRHPPSPLCALPLLSRLGRGEIALTTDSGEWLQDAGTVGGPLYLPRQHRKSATSLGGVLNGYCVAFLGTKFYKVVKRGALRVDDHNSRLAMLAVLSLKGYPTEEAEAWLTTARCDTLLHPRDLSVPLPAESAPQSRKRKRLERVESQQEFE